MQCGFLSKAEVVVTCGTGAHQACVSLLKLLSSAHRKSVFFCDYLRAAIYQRANSGSMYHLRSPASQNWLCQHYVPLTWAETALMETPQTLGMSTVYLLMGLKSRPSKGYSSIGGIKLQVAALGGRGSRHYTCLLGSFNSCLDIVCPPQTPNPGFGLSSCLICLISLYTMSIHCQDGDSWSSLLYLTVTE